MSRFELTREKKERIVFLLEERYKTMNRIYEIEESMKTNLINIKINTELGDLYKKDMKNSFEVKSLFLIEDNKNETL